MHYVGILLNADMHRGVPRQKTGQESLTNYEEAARMNGLMPCYLRLKDINLESGLCLAYMLQEGKYRKVQIPIPEVIHNRAIYLDAGSKRKVEKMLASGYFIFNGFNRYGKDEIHGLLSLEPRIKQHLPETKNATLYSVQEMMELYDDIILKPCTGSVGNGIMRLRRSGSAWTLTLPYRRKPDKLGVIPFHQGQLPPVLLERIRRTPYIVQERIKLAEYRKRPYDMRVTIQRGISGEWGITGIYAKAAAANAFVSNVAKGGKAFPVEIVLRESLPSLDTAAVVSDIRQLAYNIAKQLEKHLPLAADLGLDIGITLNGKPYFIECNGRDQRYGFRKAGLIHIWKNSYREPMAYARYLLNRYGHSPSFMNPSPYC